MEVLLRENKITEEEIVRKSEGWVENSLHLVYIKTVAEHSLIYVCLTLAWLNCSLIIQKKIK